MPSLSYLRASRRGTIPTAAVVAALFLSLTAALSCGRGSEADDQPETERSSRLTSQACTSSTVKVLDLHADFRDIWQGRESADTGKQADPNLKVGVDFNTTVAPAQVSAQFQPVKTDGSCGVPVASAPASALIASQAWGTSTSDTARAPVPSAFSVLVRDSITGIVSAGGPIAAGGDVALSSMSVNGTVRQPVGLIAGGKVTLTNGSVSGNLTYGVASTIPQTVSVSGTKTLQSFSTTAAFQDLTSLAVLLAEETPTGTTTSAGGTLQLTGTSTTLNSFQVSADALSQASQVQLTVPANAGAIVNVTGNMTVSLQNKGLSVQGATASTILWNIPSAAFVQISGVSVQGSILAPSSLVTFDSGNINGTLVAAAFASSGSGSLQYTALNVTKLFPATTPSLVRLTPAQPLVRGCAYQFVIPGTVPLTAGGACLSPPINVTFRVSASSAPPAGRELTRVEPDPVLHTMRRFTARPGINTPVDEVWARYQSAIGIAVSNLAPTTVSVPSSTRPGQMVTVYQQYAQGYPVAGYGYFVATEGGLFRAANGKVAPGLPVFPPAAVSAATALQTALTFLKITQAPWIANPSVNHAPVGRLVVRPKRSYPKATDFALAWDFRFGAGTGIFEPTGIEIDAATGAVLGADSGLQSVTPLNSQATYKIQVSSSVDTIYDGPQRPFPSVAQYSNPDQSVVTTLANDNITSPTVLATVTGVTEDAQEHLVGTPQFIVDATPNTPWVAGDPVEQKMATLQWGLETANTFMQTLNLRIGGVPWLNVDGPTAHQKVLINFTNALPLPTISSVHYAGGSSTPDAAQIFIYQNPQFLGFQAGTVAHEYAHALVDSLRRAAGLGGATGVGTLANYKEAGSLNEGIADLFAISMSHQGLSVRATPWYCVEIDRGHGPECLRNIAQPALSTDDPLNSGQAGQPPLYLDTLLGYHDFTNDPVSNCTTATDNCGAHLNSTIISHWGYILGLGVASSGNACRLAIDPLDPDPDKSLRMALNIALIAISSRHGQTSGGLTSDATFADFRDSTLQVADELVASGVIPPEAVAKIELAWAAVGLPPLASHSDVAAPANLAGAYPWATFTWPLNGDGQTGTGSWDFQITNSSFDTNVTFHQDGITGVGKDSLTGVLPLALPPNSTDTFLWRVRPNTNLPWEICYPIHSFVGTTVPDTVNDMQVVKELESVKGKVVPGPFDVSWDFVRGTVAPNYDSWIGTTKSPQCPPGAEATKLPTDALFDDGVTQSDSVGFITQPDAHYFMTVQPSGPPDFTGATAHGACATLEFDTGALAPPTYDQPGFVPTSIFDTSWSPGSGLKWETSGGAAKSLVYLFDRDENGVCGTTPLGDPVTVTLSGAANSIGLVPGFPGNTTLPNPTGYCWDVVDVAANGDQSAPSSPPGQFGFEALAPIKTSPGVTLSDAVNLIPAPLPGDSYGADVVFDWVTDARPGFPAAPAYGLRIGRWPWTQQLTTPEPSNGALFDALLESTTPKTDYTQIFRAGDEKRVSGANAGIGRYCWSVWPILDDPQVPGQAWARQPQVSLDPIWCYTTGPAPPRFTVPASAGYSIGDAAPPAAFSSQTIQGEIDLDYIPNAQVKGQGSSSDITFGPSCQSSGTFHDVYDCKIPFTIAPKPSTTYTIDLWTYNSDLATPVMDDTTQVHHVVETIKTGPCGATGQVCCPNKVCDQVICLQSKCVESTVTITSPPDGTRVAPGDTLTMGWTDPVPPVSWHLTFTSATSTLDEDQPASQNIPATGGDVLLTNFSFLVSQEPFTVKVCPVYPNGTFGNCDQRSINPKKAPPPPPDCSVKLGAPDVPVPFQPAALCAGMRDPDAEISCIFFAPTPAPCANYIPSNSLALGWDPVPGAVSYRVTQFGAFSTNTFTITPAAKDLGAHVTTGISLTTLEPLGDTVNSCSFAGYAVAITAIDACGKDGDTTLTAIGYEP